MSAPHTSSPIDGVIGELKRLIDWTLAQASRIGYFASLYLRVTNTIRSKIGTGYFDDDSRMEQLDVAFASRYLAAVRQFQSGDPALPKAWAVAFQATGRGDLIIVQHLLLAMNPHINIDLAVAAARTCPGNAIQGLRGDFDKVNAILSSVVPTVISEIDALSPYLHLLADLAEDGETSIIDFSIDAARDASWAMTGKLAALPLPAQEEIIAAQNVPVAALGQAIASPGFIVEEVIKTIGAAEVKDVDRIIRKLNSGALLVPRPSATAVSAATPLATAQGAPPAASAQTEAGGGVGQKPANEVYYLEVGMGSWSGPFTFQITSWRRLWSSSMSLKNKLLASAMGLWQKIFRESAIASELTPSLAGGRAKSCFNRIRIHQSWFTLWRSNEQYTLHADGHRVSVDARVNFGPISSLFREHDLYPATVIDGGMRNLYHIKLLGTRFLGDYRVQPGRRQVLSTLANDWAVAHETLNKVSG